MYKFKRLFVYIRVFLVMIAAEIAYVFVRNKEAYWGVKLELLSRLDGVDPDLGVSCVLANNEKGRQWLSSVVPSLSLTPSDRQSAEKRNKQLTNHSVPLPEHQTLLHGYIENGYPAFLNGYKKHVKDHLIRTAKNMIPAKIKRKLKNR